MNEVTPLVSVVVITYNSSQYIKETLESVKAQTYRNIELIVSDDCSTDNTVKIIKDWIELNKNYFRRALLVETPKNTGVAPNVNRGIRQANGEWIKGLSGDDQLLPDSIKDYIEFVTKNPQCNICFGKLHFWGENKDFVSKQQDYYEQNYYPYLKADYKTQFMKIQEILFVPGPGLFYKKELWERIGGLDERFPFADEYPFTYNVLESGEQIYFLDKEVYGYQIREGSLCKSMKSKKTKLNPIVFNNQYKYIRQIHIWKMIKHGYPFLAYHILIHYYRTSLANKNCSSFIMIITRLLFILSPYAYIKRLKKIFHH